MLSRAQDNAAAVINPLAKRLNATPIMGGAPPAWIRAELNAATAAFTAAQHPSFLLDALGFTQLSGVLISAAGVGAGTTLFTLPVSLRPVVARFFNPFYNGGALGLQVAASGAVSNVAAIAAGGIVALDGVFFLAGA